MTKDLVSNSSIASFVDYMYTQGTADNLGLDWFVEIDGMLAVSCLLLLFTQNPLVYGGEIARATSDVTSFFNRDAFLTFQFYASAKPLSSPYPASGFTFLDGMHDAVKVDSAAACRLFRGFDKWVVVLTRLVRRSQLHRPYSLGGRLANPVLWFELCASDVH
jgi:hypothetical protein